jgi:hypothetical protein
MYNLDSNLFDVYLETNLIGRVLLPSSPHIECGTRLVFFGVFIISVLSPTSLISAGKDQCW